MKRFIFIMLVAFVALAANAQKQNYPFSNDTISADTNLYASNVLVDGYANTVISFTFTKVDVTDSLSVAKIQGSNDNTTFVDLTDATANLTSTSTDGTTVLYLVNPLFLYYRGFLACASGDAVAITNPRFIIKED